MENINLIDSFAESIQKHRPGHIDESIGRYFQKYAVEKIWYGWNFDIIINIDKGDLEIWRNRTVVEDDKLENPNSKITLTERKKSMKIMNSEKKLRMK